MKKIFLVSILAVFSAYGAVASDMLPAGGYYETTTADCDVAAMRRTLDNATADRRAVVTVVKCAPRVAAPAPKPAPVIENTDACIDGAAPVERVVRRRVYVTETVMRYQPVVHYVPVGTYTRTRRVCSECGM